MSSFLGNVSKVIIVSNSIGICLLVIYFGMSETFNIQEKYFLRSLVSLIITILLGCTILKISIVLKIEKIKEYSNMFFIFEIGIIFLLLQIIVFFSFPILSEKFPFFSFLTKETFLICLFSSIFILELFQNKRDKKNNFLGYRKFLG